jgi:hypothetical protein
MRAQVNIQTAGAEARNLQALTAGAAKHDASAACRKIQGLRALAGRRAISALMNPVAKATAAAKYRTGLLVGYLVKGYNGFDGAFFVQNRKGTPLKLRWCVWGADGERLIPVQTVIPDIMPGHETVVPFAVPGAVDIQGIAALWDAETLDDGVEDQFTGCMAIIYRTPASYALQQLVKIPDLRGATAATRKQGSHISYNTVESGLDTVLVFVNPNHAFTDFPGGTLTGIATPQCSVTPESARFYGDNGTEFDLLPQPPVFPLHAWEAAVVSTVPPWRGAGGESIAGKAGTVEYVFTGNIAGLYFYFYAGSPLGLAEMPRAFEI